jgi:hypothetical protein
VIAGAAAQAPAPASPPTATDRAAIAAASAAERDRELKLLGITAMQPPATAYDIGKPGNANYDESKANPYPKLPDVLTMNDGTRVTTPEQWKKRRAEIKAMFDENVYGKYPAHIPQVTWKVDGVEPMTVQGLPAIVKHITGHVDNSAYPAITVEIHADVVTPASTKGTKVPVIIGGGSIRPRPAFARPAPAPGQVVHMLSSPPDAPDSAKLLLAHGWGFVGRNSGDVQADNGAGLNQGIIGLVNKGQPRKPDDWGALRAWAWGASRALDYFETDKAVDARQVGIEGLSRYGKAAIVAMAYDQRFAIGFIGSSGEGGVKLHRRNYGEIVENVAGSGEYHWMAGNFIKYAGPLNWNDLPVDSHELVALCAPRPVFISAGAFKGDAWVDAKGMFLAAAGAGPVYKLLGKKDMGTTEMPPIENALIDGDVAFRQHSGGHTTVPNWPTFLTFASRYLNGQAHGRLNRQQVCLETSPDFGTRL